MDRDVPVLIQGGMGVAVSDWRLARAVARLGHLGVVSGVALDVVMVRRLQLGDPDGDIRRALEALPLPGAAERILDRYFIAGGKQADERFKLSSMKRDNPSRNVEELIIAANFVEVYLAKEGHTGPVGINYLEKVQAPTLPSLYGAMLAGVDYVLMGAGIPKTIPAVLDQLAQGNPVELRLDVKGAKEGDDFRSRFDPAGSFEGPPPTLDRPAFLAIVSSHVLAVMLATKIEVPPDGFIVEAPTAGGHNAPPRGKLRLDEGGEPIYGDRDVPDLGVIADLGLPFWLAGGHASPEGIRQALDRGAAGVQVGTAFAYCEESGFDPGFKKQVVNLSRRGEVKVSTDPLASPSGFPFKVVQLDRTLSDPDVYAEREREPCKLGYLRSAYRNDEGGIGWRCPAEPVEVYIGKGGSIEETVGRKCLCGSLLANVGLGQLLVDGTPERALITSGDDVVHVAQFLAPEAESYTAADVVRYLLPDG
ncbi:MAG: nitronate monooxygenase [Actinomycetia bacterium]|nr:nitronate monooxygenase [Actinomycetes bacterium]MCP4227166.1 nitronate monooxygenase [Actinomycetes bacterium]MCP5035904.1 nitronate monooxygenase [Actinomycetes bacterium]